LTIRSAFRLSHLALSLAGGAMLVVTGLTGSILVFRGEIDRLVNPGIHRVKPSGIYRSLEDIRAVIEREKGPPIRLILPPTNPDRSMIVVLMGKRIEDRWEVFVDPYSGEILGRRRLDQAWTHQLEKLHAEWLSGKPGKLVAGLVGLISLALSATGLVLWFQTRRRSSQSQSASRSLKPARLALDVHRWVGIITLVPSMILATSGAILVFRPYIAPILKLATGPMPLEAEPQSRGNRSLIPPSLDQIRDQALIAFPDARITRIYLPERSNGTFAVRLKLPEEDSPHGNTAIRFDRYDGSTLQVHSSRMTNSTQKLLWYAAYPWHTGDALGMSGRVIVALSGLAPTILLATGLIWWRRTAIASVSKNRVP
jgi:uncharacterized iron-regulated membrane protein